MIDSPPAQGRPRQLTKGGAEPWPAGTHAHDKTKAWRHGRFCSEPITQPEESLLTVVPLDPDSPASHAVGVDFDLTLVAHRDGWQDGRIYGAPIPGALEALRVLQARRSVFVVTARHRRYHPAVAAWLIRHGFDAIVDDDPDRAYWRGDPVLVTNKKLGGAIYIDDRGLCFEGDWDTTLAEALRRIGEPSDLPAQLSAAVGAPPRLCSRVADQPGTTTPHRV
ncbi:hypothetical protein ACFVUY_42960 [Kitasatospora sp. NPDC058063]|uniref:hypothetical protein n=1 Tax=unclassified Kitasatospora TaxID=2633591 RepID=UPI0036DB7EC0